MTRREGVLYIFFIFFVEWAADSPPAFIAWTAAIVVVLLYFGWSMDARRRRAFDDMAAALRAKAAQAPRPTETPQ